MTSNGNGKSRIPGSHPGEPNRIWVALISAPFELLPAIFFALFGILSLVLGGTLVPGSLDMLIWIVTLNWQVSMGLGGVLTVVGRVGGWDRVEQSGMALLGYAFSVYAGILIVGAFMSGSLTTIAAIALLVAFAAACAIRLYVLHQSIKARKVAGQVRHDRDQNGDSPQ